VSFDRPGYGESDPDPKRTPKSISLDIEELADKLGLGSRFYVIGFSMGGQVVWGCLKYIPHRYRSLCETICLTETTLLMNVLIDPQTSRSSPSGSSRQLLVARFSSKPVN